MVEEWNANASFSFYYKQCAPQECTYTYSGHNNVVYIVTTIIGLVGGLTKVLQVIIPPIVKFVRKKKRPKEEVAGNKFSNVYQEAKQYVKTFNIIKSYPPPIDPHDIRNQLISTRLFVVCLLAALFILTVYTALIDVTITHTVASPPLEQYEKLYENYPLTLFCPSMNSSAPSRYHINSTLNEIVSLLMVEEWNANASFSSYYKQCAPQECTYTYSGHNNVVYIVTTIIGLVGGLTKVLQVIIPPIVKFVRKTKRPKEEVAEPFLA
ncbi:unnamed protein product [Didymodactylos carnosus]|uniref:Uncharacterized protein n=1 Tax=Didymodactylos carnosus TaxID=1234261 RepID=A0A814R8Z0_9BILA|nr:unnamed protein product [Didymodactylos carnosus]CAF3893961.1 unnamed protein product [Didymodactylos carnosus]